MSVPAIGAGITVVVPSQRRPGEKTLWRAYVTNTASWSQHYGTRINWESGVRNSYVWEGTENIDWIHGHGPQARAALLAIRALRE